MAGINGYSGFYNNSYNSLFGSSSSGFGGINLGDYYMIKNGTYKKLLKSYYNTDKSDSTSKTNSSTSSVSSKQDIVLRDSAKALESSANALRNKDLWTKKDVQVKDEATGEMVTKQEYDYDAILKAVKQFANDYNSVLDEALDSDNSAVLREASNMVSSTRGLSKLLEDVGINIGADNKLSIDEEKFKSARIETLNTLFAGSSSYGDRVGQRAGNIVSRIPKSNGASSTTTKKTTTASNSDKTADKTSTTDKDNKTSTNNTSISYNSYVANIQNQTTYSPYGSAYTPYGGSYTNDILSHMIEGTMDTQV